MTSPYPEMTPEGRTRLELIQENIELRRLLGLKPWDPIDWTELVNPHTVVSVDYVAFEKVRQRGIEIQTTLYKLQPYIDRQTERRRQAIIDQVWSKQS